MECIQSAPSRERVYRAFLTSSPSPSYGRKTLPPFGARISACPTRQLFISSDCEVPRSDDNRVSAFAHRPLAFRDPMTPVFVDLLLVRRKGSRGCTSGRIVYGLPGLDQ